MSFKQKMFLILFIVPSFVAILVGFGMLSNVKASLMESLFDQRYATLQQKSAYASQRFVEADQYLEEIAKNNTVQSALRVQDPTFYEEQKAVIRPLLAQKNYIEAFILVDGSPYFATSQTDHYSADKLSGYDWYQQTLDADGGIVTAGPFFGEDEGIFSIYLVKSCLIKDLLTGEPLGIAVFEVSTAVMAESLTRRTDNYSEAVIADRANVVVASAVRKEIGRKIDEAFGLDKELDTEYGYSLVRRQGEDYLALRTQLDQTGYDLVEFVQIETLTREITQMGYVITLLILFLVVLIFVIDFFFTSLISKPIIKMEQAMLEVTGGNLDVRVTITTDDEFGRMSEIFNEMVENTQKLITSVKQSERKRRKAETDFLYQQINPHFTYNTLTSVKFLVAMNKNSEAEEMLSNFIKFLRYSAHNTAKLVKLQQELAQVETLCNILKISYPGRFCFETKVDEETLDKNVPAFSIQPVVENAVFHNLAGNKGICRIRVMAKMVSGKMVVRVTDNGVGISREKLKEIQKGHIHSKEGIGLRNVDSRLKLYCGESCGLKVSSKLGIGTRVDFILNYKGEDRIENTGSR